MQNQIDLQPNSIEAEEAVIGALLIDPDAILRIPPEMEGGDFFLRRNGYIFEVIKDTFKNGDSCDMLTLSDELQRRGQLTDIGGPGYLSDMINAPITSVNVDYYAAIVERKAALRRLINAGTEIVKMAYADEPGQTPETILTTAESLLLEAAPADSQRVRPIGAVIESVFDRVDRINGNPDVIIGLPTGLTDIDRILGGLQKSDLIIVAGRPGMGKTSLAMQIGFNAAEVHKANTLIFSIEMSAEQLTQRAISARTGISTADMRRGSIPEDKFPDFVRATSQLNGLPLTIEDSGAVSATSIKSIALRHKARHGLDLIVIDYLQIMNADQRGQNRNAEISDITRALKQLARALDIPIVLLSQLSRAVESRGDKRPQLSDLRDSGSIEQDADIVLFIYRPSEYNPGATEAEKKIAEIIIAKHRNGETGAINLYFDKAQTKFKDLAMRTTPLDWASA